MGLSSDFMTDIRAFLRPDHGGERTPLLERSFCFVPTNPLMISGFTPLNIGWMLHLT